MANQSRMALARKEAAASITWPAKTAVLLNPDPAIVRRQITRPMIAAAVALGLFLIICDAHGPVAKLAQSMENKEMRPAMEAAMANGSHAAGTWLAMHFHEEHPGLLEQEANAGEPTAMYDMGVVLTSGGAARRFVKLDPALSDDQIAAQGKTLILKAADAGNQDALKFAVKHQWTDH
ncbi:hypothetical protein [Paraburkholderia youngii]|uniref:hypothetical protein n=1 Tax=Paraburkholderia youngii TaxID=2782701 RepID=UPI003D218006